MTGGRRQRERGGWEQWGCSEDSAASCRIFTWFATSLSETDREPDRARNRDSESQTDGDKQSAEV